MRLEAAITGDLHLFMKQQVRAAEKAVTQGVLETTVGLKADLRARITRSGLGGKLARTWQHKRYPGSGYSIGAAGLVYSKAPLIVRAFSEGALIKSANGLFLAIPTPAAPRFGVGGKRISPSNFPEHSLGKLRFVYRGSAPSLLVVDGLRAGTGKRGGFRKASATALRTGRGLTTVVMFILLPQVQLKKRLDIEAARNHWLPQLPNLILKHWPENNAEQTRTNIIRAA